MTVTRHRTGTKAPDSAAAEAGYSLPEKGAEGEGASREQPCPVKHAPSPGAGESRPVPAVSQCPREEAARRGRPAGANAHPERPGGSAPRSAPFPRRATVPRLLPPPPREGKLCPSLERRRRWEPGSRRLFTTFPAAPPRSPRTSELLSAVLSTAIFCHGSASCARGIFPARLPQPPLSAFPHPGGEAGEARQTVSPPKDAGHSGWL